MEEKEAELTMKRVRQLQEIEAILQVCPFPPRAQTGLLSGYVLGIATLSPMHKYLAQASLTAILKEHPEGREILELLNKFLEDKKENQA